MEQLSFGVQAAQAFTSADPDLMATTAQQIESAGYDALYTFDHLGAPDPFLPLIVAASSTSEIRLGPLVANAGFHHPLLLARTAVTLDRMTAGRAVLGVGAGWASDEYAAMGLAFDRAPQRVSRLAESLVTLRQLLGGGSVAMRGAYITAELVDLGVQPVGARVPLIVGGFGERMLRLGAEHADEVQLTGLHHAADGSPSPTGFRYDDVAARVRIVEDHARSCGRGRPTISILSTVVDLTDESSDAHKRASETTGLDHDELVRSPFVLIGSTVTVADKLLRLRDHLGISRIVVTDPLALAPVVERLVGA